MASTLAPLSPTSPSSSGPSGRKLSTLLTTMTCSVFLSSADAFVVVIALPTILGGLSLGVDQLQEGSIVNTSYLVAYIAVLPLCGALCDRFPRRLIAIGALNVFCVGGVVTALSSTLGSLVLGRALQGAGGGACVPVVLAVVADTWSIHRRDLPLGIVGAIQETGSLAGPLIGAGILAFAPWQGIFWVNVAVGLVLLFPLCLTAPKGPRLMALAALLAGVLALGGVILVAAEPTSLTTTPVGQWAFTGLTSHLAQLSSPVALGTLLLLIGALTGWFFAVRRWPADTTHDHPAHILWWRPLATGVLLTLLVVSFSLGNGALLSPLSVVTLPAALLIGCALLLPRFIPQSGTPPMSGATRWRVAVVAINGALGVTLSAILVGVSLLVRNQTDTTQATAALVLVEFLIGVPLGAFAGGAFARRVLPRPWVITGGLFLGGVMLGQVALSPQLVSGHHLGIGAVCLFLTGIGVGAPIAPLGSLLLDHSATTFHARAASLMIAARSTGILVGLSLIVSIGFSTFTHIISSATLPAGCSQPLTCPATASLVTNAIHSESQVMLAAGALALLAAAVVGAVQIPFGDDRTSTSPTK